ncbi:MAG: C40 family peptidase [Armatimonadetes bacterium]|nr:C40 family peptidase [Armatimonadota bacterium]
MAAVVASAIAAGSAWFITFHAQQENSPQIIGGIPQAILSQSPSLQLAYDRYTERGSKYIWGTNDCSVFLIDYMKGQGAPIKKRWTTRELFEPAKMDVFGYNFFGYPPEQSKAGDLVVFRYIGTEGTEVGHCGIVIEEGEQKYVVHNSSPYGGVVTQSADGFFRQAKSLNANLRIFRPKAHAHTI